MPAPIASLISPILAQSEEASTSSDWMGSPMALVRLVRESKVDFLNRGEDLSAALGQLGLLWALIFAILGGICVINGYRWHKTIVLVLSILCGAAIGVTASKHVGVAPEIAGALVAILFSVLAWPVMKFTIALFAGMAGAFCGANAWTALGQPADQHHIGSIIGLIALAMLAFIAYRLVVIVFTAIGGAAMLTLGVLAGLLYVDPWNASLQQSLSDHSRMLPMIAGVIAIVGVVVQQGGGIKGLVECADKADPAKRKPQAKPA